MGSRGFSIRIFLPTGSPDGLRIIEKSNWTGCGLVCPRSLLPDAKGRPEFQRAGVYVLTGVSPTSELPAVYIGEGDPVRPRLEMHALKRDFWNSAVLFTSRDPYMNKAHVQFLESRLVELARDARRCELENGNVPRRPSLSEADEAEVEAFLAEMLLCFPLVGITVFERPSGPVRKAQVLVLRGKGITAKGYESAEGFVVLKGAQVVTEEVPSLHPHVVNLRRNLLKNGVLRSDGTTMALVQDYVFNSPSIAASLLLAKSSNGRDEWKTADGKSLKQVQEEQLSVNEDKRGGGD